MNGISSYVISLVHSLSDSSLSISVVFLVQLYSIRHRYDIFATSFRIRLSEKAQELGTPDPPGPPCPLRLCGCAGSLYKNTCVTNDRAIGASLTSLYGETRIPLATTPPLGRVRWRDDYIRRGKSILFATVVISCSEQDHMSISVLDNHIFTDHVVRTHSHTS
jgi:hypothetical protein